MTQDQIMGLLRQLLPFLGGIAIAFGFLTPDKVAKLTADILAIAGPLATLGSVIWALIANKQTSIAASMGANPSTEVKPAAGGTATITIKDPEMAKAALDAQKTS